MWVDTYKAKFYNLMLLNFTIMYCIITAMNKKTQENQTEEERKAIHIEVVKQMLNLATAGFGLVSALAWNSLIQEFVNTYVKKWIPDGGGLISLLIYALIVTSLAVFVTLQLSRLVKKLDPHTKT